MNSSMNVVLLRDKEDSTYKKYLNILLSCKECDINPPAEVDKYFGGGGAYNDPEYPLEMDFKLKEWGNDYVQGYEIDVTDLPEGVKTIRFYISY